MVNYLTLHTLVTPAPLHRRRNSPQTILTSIHPSLRAWLAPLIYPRIRTTTQQDFDSLDRQSVQQPSRINGGNRLALNQFNLDAHLLQLLLANYELDDETDIYGPREREAVDVLQDSARVAHQVAALLADYESQRKFPPHLALKLDALLHTRFLRNPSSILHPPTRPGIIKMKTRQTL